MNTATSACNVRFWLSFTLAFAITIPCHEVAAAAQITRGPYLQSGTTTNIIVRWRTDSASDSRVLFGLSTNSLPWQVSNGSSTTEHIVTLTNLAPGTKYFYAVGTATQTIAGGSEDFHFFTAPTNAKPTRIWVIGDHGTSQLDVVNECGGLLTAYRGKEEAVRDAYYTNTGPRPTDVWLTAGDNALGCGTDLQFQNGTFNVFPDLLRRSVIWPTVGNHDLDSSYPSVPYFDVFSLPTQGQAGGVPSGTENYYSFTYGNVHFVCLDSEASDLSPGGPMLRWLTNDLASSPSDWLIASWHRPPYTKGVHDSDVGWLYQDWKCGLMRSNAVPILEAYGVDLVLCAHNHHYERSYLIDAHYGTSDTFNPTNKLDGLSGNFETTGAYVKDAGRHPHQGAVYVVAGSSGWITESSLTVQHPAMFMAGLIYGSMVIDIASNRLDAVFLGINNIVYDRFAIIKGTPPRIDTVLMDNGTMRLRWKCVAGQTYRVEQIPGLEATNWQSASLPMTARTAGMGWTNAVSAATSRNFYRVVKLAE